MVTSVFHVGMTVSDLEYATDFFTFCFDMEVVHSQVQDNSYSRRLVGEPNARFRIAQLRFRDAPVPQSGHVVELISYDSPELNQLSLRNPQPGAMHLAFLVSNIESVFGRVLERRGLAISEPIDITEGINAGGRACYMRGPDGITIELLQRPVAADAANDVESSS